MAMTEEETLELDRMRRERDMAALRARMLQSPAPTKESLAAERNMKVLAVVLGVAVMLGLGGILLLFALPFIFATKMCELFGHLLGG